MNGEPRAGWQRRPGEPITFQLNDQLVELAKSPPVADLWERGPNDVERRASRALAWWERSFSATDPVIKIVFLFAALEAILGNRNEGIKSDDLAMHRAALSEALDEGFSSLAAHLTCTSMSVRWRSTAKSRWLSLVTKRRAFEWDIRRAINEYLRFAQRLQLTKRKQVRGELEAKRVEIEAWLGGDDAHRRRGARRRLERRAGVPGIIDKDRRFAVAVLSTKWSWSWSWSWLWATSDPTCRLSLPFQMPPDELNPRVTARKLPPRIARNRLEQASRDATDRARLQQPIAVHLLARRIALDALATAHQALADGCDLDMTGSTRLAAVWQMAGRCLGIAQALICLVEHGFTAEVLHLGRALHEATRLLSALGDPNEDALLRKWLAGEYVSPGTVRAAEERYEERLAAAMAAEGRSELPRTGPVTKKIYTKMSEAGHISGPPSRATLLHCSERWYVALIQRGSAAPRPPS